MNTGLVAQFGESLRICRVPMPIPGKHGLSSLELTETVLERGERDALGAISWRRVEPSIERELFRDLVAWVERLTGTASLAARGIFDLSQAARHFPGTTAEDAAASAQNFVKAATGDDQAELLGCHHKGEPRLA